MTIQNQTPPEWKTLGEEEGTAFIIIETQDGSYRARYVRDSLTQNVCESPREAGHSNGSQTASNHLSPSRIRRVSPWSAKESNARKTDVSVAKAAA